MTSTRNQKMNTPENKKPQENTLDHLFRLTMQKKWNEVVKFYQKHPSARGAILTKSKETALHVAVSSYSAERVDTSCADAIKQMIDCISEGETDHILSMRNDKGNTPLHLAAAVGWEDICQFVATKNRNLIAIRNEENETPLFVAAHHGNLEAFLCLHHIYGNLRRKGGNTISADRHGNQETLQDICTEDEKQEPDDSLILLRRKDGNTILHSAISGEHFELAYQIIQYYPKLVNFINENGETPLHVLAGKPNVFNSSSQLGPYDSIIYHSTPVKELKKQDYVPGNRKNSSSLQSDNNYAPNNWRTCVDIWPKILLPICKTLIGGREKDTSNGKQTDLENQQKNESQAKHPEEEGKQRGSFPPNYTTCILLFKFGMKVTLTVLGGGISRIRKIQEKKRKCSQAIQIMEEMIELEGSYKYNGDGEEPVARQGPAQVELPPGRPSADDVDSNRSTETKTDEAQEKDKKEKDQTKPDKKSTPLLIAAKKGIPEMVEKILCKFPIAVQDVDSEGKNVLLLAAENRQTSVFSYLLEMKLPHYMFHHVDKNGNSILHLAANLGEVQPWRIPGAALQMQWELKWYRHVKDKIPPLQLDHENKFGETPHKIFSRTHKDLVKDGSDWLIKTSESCSLIAALVAGVAFATSATVPGGLDEQSGYPKMKGHIEFDVFSISSLVALCLSVTALVFFLVIITSRCQEHDFKSALPKMLLLGLTSLFGSIAAVLLSFCAGHIFVLREKLRLAVLPIYAAACLPVLFFAIAKLPLYFDLLWAASAKVPLRSYKVFYQ